MSEEELEEWMIKFREDAQSYIYDLENELNSIDCPPGLEMTEACRERQNQIRAKIELLKEYV